MKMPQIYEVRETAVHKVTAFITRQQQGRRQLLLFRHPTAGIQIPAGTVEQGEDWRTAALREAAEETGLSQLSIQGYLGKIDNELAPGEAVLRRDCQILSRPDERSRTYSHTFSRGVTVQIGPVNGRYRQVIYREYDQLPHPTAVALEIIGWLPREFLSFTKIRHYTHLLCREETPSSWMLPSDNNHIFAPFWVDLQPKPAVVSPQNRWLNDVYHQLLQQG